LRTNLNPSSKAHTLRFKLSESSVDVTLFHFEIGNSIAQQAANSIIFLKDRNGMPGSCKLLGGCQSGWAGTHHGNGFPSEALWRMGRNITVIESVIDYRNFNFFNCYRRLVYRKNTT
jgi:hypothetical protein